MTFLLETLVAITIISTAVPVNSVITTSCPLPPCQNPCGPFEMGAFKCTEGDGMICQGYADCSGCYAKYFLNGVETMCTTSTTLETTKPTTTVTSTTPCLLPPCVNPCDPFENSINLNGDKPHCEGHPNTRCQGYAECNKGCYAKYFDTITNEEIIDCVLTYDEPINTDKPTTTNPTTAEPTTAEPTTTGATTTRTADIKSTKSTECHIECADPCAMSECKLYPDANCDFTVDCNKGCTAFYTDKNGNILDCDGTTTTSSSTTKTSDCLIDCADPCGINECKAYPNAICDFTVDCDRGCIPFFTDTDGNRLNCDDTTTSDPIYSTKSSGNQLGIFAVTSFLAFLWIYRG